jgi:hypothetical protein
MATQIGGTNMGSPVSTMYAGYAGAKLLSMYSNVNGLVSPNTMAGIRKQYGKGLYMRDFYRAKGQEIKIPSQDLNIIEERSEYRTIKIKNAIASGAAGAAITVTLHADNYESTMQPLLAREKIRIPAQFLAKGQNNSAEYMSLVIGTQVTLPADTWTFYPLPGTNTQIAYTIPAGTELEIGSIGFAVGEGQPKGKQTVPVAYLYTSNLVKASVGIEEQVLSQKNEPMEYNGNMWIINKLTAETERRLDRYEDIACHRGNKNQNTSVLVGASSITGDNGIIKSGDGLTTLLDTYGMCNYYDTTFDLSHLDIVTDGFIANEIYTTDVSCYLGNVADKDISAMMRGYFQSYSKGSDLYDEVKNKLGVTPHVINWNGVNFYFQVVSTLSDVTAAGIQYNGQSLYEYPTSLIFIPDNAITVKKFGEEVDASIPNVGIGYVDYNGETLGRVSGVLKGMTNVVPGNMGTDAGGWYYHWSSAFTFFGGTWNQKFYFRKTLVKA